jgi:hypothetical protein
MARGGVSPVTSESKDDIPISQEDTKFLRSNAIVIGNDKITTKTAPNFLYNRPTNKQPKLPTSLNKKSLDLKVQYSSKTTNYTYTVVLVTASKIILTSVNSSQILVYNHSHQLNQKSQLFNMPTVDETTRRTRSTANNSKTNHTSLDASKPKDPKKKSPMATKIIEELPTDEEFMPSFSDDEDGASNVNKHISEMNNGVPEKINEEGMNVDPAEPEKPTDEEMKDQGNDSSTSSPIKKRSKREVLSALITPKVTPKPPSNSATKRNHAGNEKPKETPTANANSKKATSPKTAQDPPEKTPSPKGQSSKTTKPASVLKNSKYKSAEESEKKQPPKPHDHKFKRTIFTGAVDWSKSALATYGDDNPKKLHTALSSLVTNINFCDDTAIIPHKDALNLAAIGPSGHKVPTNLTQLSNYFFGINAKQLNSRNKDEDGDALSSLKPGKKGGKGKGKLAYFSFLLSSDVDPVKIAEQVGLEWSRFGSFIKVKELQAIETETPIVVHSLFVDTPKHVLQAELELCLQVSQEHLRDNYKWDSDLPFDVTHGKIPAINLRSSVPMIPKANTHGVSDLPRNIQACRRCIHLETAVESIEMMKQLVAHGKKIGIFKEVLGAHVHFTETVDWESTAGDLKRAAKFHRSSTNYNASMTQSEVHGFLNLNEKVTVKGQKVSGRICLSSLLKFGDNNSTLLAEVHQAEPGGVTYLVYPNTPAAEAMVLNLTKNPAFFLKNYLIDMGVDVNFAEELVSTYCDPSLIHEGEGCEWIGETFTVLTWEELQDQDESNKLEGQEWFVDVVKQYEELTKQENSGRKSKNYAAAAALYDLDAQRSVGTMHEKHDGIENREDMEEKSEEGVDEDGAEINDRGSARGEKEEAGSEDGQRGLPEEVDREDASVNQQSGYSPKRGSVRFNDGNGDGAHAGYDDSSSIEDVTPDEEATASAAGKSHVPSGTGESG